MTVYVCVCVYDVGRTRQMVECAICLALLCEPITTPCGHSFCRPCLVSTLRKNKKKCPSCRCVCEVGGRGRVSLRGWSQSACVSRWQGACVTKRLVAERVCLSVAGGVCLYEVGRRARVSLHGETHGHGEHMVWMHVLLRRALLGGVSAWM